ncbi:MAG: hypothetical protein LBV74_01110 [Tannerella sp.]|jgi:hypothetical protein|nr:hypothetical protein [Tannerella sp.]
MTDLHLTVPTSWKELSPRQLKFISYLMTEMQLSADELLTHAFIGLAGIKVLKQDTYGYVFSHKRRYFILSVAEFYEFTRKVQWITGGVSEVTPLSELAGVKHVHPRLCDTPFNRYLACENYYQQYIFTQNIQALQCLAACFYAGKKEFDDSQTLNNSEKFADLPVHVLHTVFLWYAGLKTVFQKQFSYLFRPAEAVGEAQAPNMREHIDNMIRALTGGDVTKTEAVANTETWTAFSELNAKARESEELKNRMAKMRK